MNLIDIIFTAVLVLSVTANIVILLFLKNNKTDKYLLIINSIPFLLFLIHYLLFGLNVLFIPLYAASIILIGMYFIKHLKAIYMLLTILVIILSFTPTVFFTYMKYNVSVLEDFSSKSYTQSFQALHNEIVEIYPFTNLKGIDMDSKYAEYRKLFEKADKDNSKEEYYTALRQYMMSFYDGHFQMAKIVQLMGMSDPLARDLILDNIGGSYGFTVTKLDNETMVASIVEKGSAAESAGIKLGAVITKWNGKPVRDAVKEISLLWNMQGRSMANENDIERNQIALLTRGLVGAQSSVSFMDANDLEQTITLTATADNLTLLKNDLDTFCWSSAEDENLSYKIINDTHGYIILNSMPSDKDGEAYQKFYDALTELVSGGVKDIIIDARSNTGGYDEFGAHILELLSNEKIYYLKEFTYSEKYEKYTSVQDAFISNPNAITRNIPIVILINNQTISAGEGFVYNASKLPNVRIAGMTGTNGSFGTIVKSYIMPDNYLVLFPQIACFNENGEIMIDTDSNHNGGIQPDIKIPIDRNALQSLYADKIDYELSYIINTLNDSSSN